MKRRESALCVFHHVHDWLPPHLLQGVGLVAALVQQAVSRVGGDQGASGVSVVNGADVGSGAVRGSCRTRKIQYIEICQAFIELWSILQGHMSSVVFDRGEHSENILLFCFLLKRESQSRRVNLARYLPCSGCFRPIKLKITCPRNHTKHIFVEGIFNAVAGFLRRHRRLVSGRLKHRHSLKRPASSSFSLPQIVHAWPAQDVGTLLREVAASCYLQEKKKEIKTS